MASSPTSHGLSRREEARLKAQALQQEQARRERRSRIVLFASLLIGVLAVVGVGWFILQQQPSQLSSDMTEFPEDVTIPTAASPEDGGITYYNGNFQAEAPTDVPVLDVYLDFMCTHCADFEMTNGDWLKESADNGELAWRLHPVGVLQSQYSDTMGSAFAYLVENSPEHALEFAKMTFANFKNTGQSEEELRSYAQAAGVPSEHIDGMLEGDYVRYIQSASAITLNDESLRDEEGRFGTPALYINGERSNVNWTDPQLLKDAVLNAGTSNTTGDDTSEE